MTDADNAVHFFKTFQFKAGQKIHIVDGPRRGDWLVVMVEETHVTLQCPISQKQFRWPLFCYFHETKEKVAWPQPE